jgi:hypothetical protein
MLTTKHVICVVSLMLVVAGGHTASGFATTS